MKVSELQIGDIVSCLGDPVKELMEALQTMPQDKEVVMFDGPSKYTPCKVYVADWGGKGIKGNVVID